MAIIMSATGLVHRGIFAGDKRIAGTVTVDAAGAARQVLLLIRDYSRVIAVTRSADDGSYSFEALNGNKTYLVLALDRSNQANAAVADRITPVT